MNEHNSTTYGMDEESQESIECGSITIHQRLIIHYTTKVCSLLSIIASALLIVTIVRSIERRKRIFQRLILALSINHLIVAVAFFVGVWALPKGTNCTLQAIGNEHTCNAQGMFIQIGFFGSAVYNSSLALYSFLAVLNDFKEGKFRWIEKWIHIVAFVASPLVAIVFVIGNTYESHFIVCLKGYSEESAFSPSTYNILNKALNVIPRITMGAFSIITFTALFVVEVYKRRHSLGLSGKQKFLEDARRLKSKYIAQQSCLYLIIFYICASFGFFFRDRMPLEVDFWVAFVLSVLVPIQGFYVAIIYFIFFKRFQKIKENNNSEEIKEEYNAGLSYHTRDIARTDSTRTDSARTDSARSISAAESADMNKELPMSTEEQFVIFDGSNPSQKWAKYIFDESEVDVIVSDEESNDLDSLTHT